MKKLILFVVTIVLFGACTDLDYDVRTTHYFYNKSGQDILVKFYNKKKIKTQVIKNGESFSNNIHDINMRWSPFFYPSDSIEVIYNEERIMTYHCCSDTTANNPYIIKSYKFTDTDNYTKKFEYTFSENDYMRAKSTKSL